MTGETLVQCGHRIRAAAQRLREMGTEIDPQLEGYLILKKVALNESQLLAVTTMTSGNYEADV
eukprot:8204335-Prorocentrum_lima.AAC.1